MCGLHFVINSISNPRTEKLDDFMSDAFIANQVRGTDSSGVFQIGKGKDAVTGLPPIRMYKDAVCGTDFVGNRQAKDILNLADVSTATVGHVRAATHGIISLQNAHPFQSTREDKSRIIGVHNGSLKQGWRMLRDTEKHQVDSSWLYERIAEDGIDAFEGIDGAFALVWYDTLHPGKLFVARNEERPLFWAHTEDGKGMIAASELGMLGWLAGRRGLKLRKSPVTNAIFHQPAAGKMYTIDLENPLQMVEQEFKKYDAAKRKYGRVYTASSYNYGNSRRSWIDDEDYNPYDMSGRGRSHGTYYNNGQVTVLTDLRTALLTAERTVKEEKEGTTPLTKQELDEDVKAVSLAGLERAMKSAVDGWSKKQEEQPLPAGTFRYTYGDIKDKSASEGERSRAKSLNMYGMVVQLRPFHHDEETLDLWGDFHLIENGKQEDYDTMIRGISTGAATKIMHGDGEVPVVIIGVTDERNPMCIAVPLEEGMVTQLVRNINTKAKRSNFIKSGKQANA